MSRRWRCISSSRRDLYPGRRVQGRRGLGGEEALEDGRLGASRMTSM